MEDKEGTYSLRRARPDDALRIAVVHVEGWRWGYRGLIPEEILTRLSVPARETMWRRILSAHDSDVVWVAERAGAVVGFAAWGRARGAHHPPLTAELYALYQDPSVLGSGLAGKLLSAAVEDMQSAGHRGAVLWVLDANERARGFYEHCGWTCDGASKAEVLDGFELREVRYSRTLAPG